MSSRLSAMLVSFCFIVIALRIPAVDFPLNRHDMTASEALGMPVVAGVTALLSTSPPRALAQEPVANSMAPLYGNLVCGSNYSILFRLDSALVNADSLLFTSNSFLNATNFGKKLTAQSDTLTQYLMNRFSAESRKALVDINSSQKRIQTVLSEEFNKIINEKSIYHPLRFQKVKLSRQTVALGSQVLTGEHLMRFNRLLLECAYPLDIVKNNPLTGYGELILDLNGNGDLNDEKVYMLLPPNEMPKNTRNLVFGPIPCPGSCVLNGWDPQWFAEVELFAGANLNSDSAIGSLKRRVGTYLEADVQLGRYHTKVAVLDADANFHLGESLRGEAGYLANPNRFLSSPGDLLLIDYNQSGQYEASAMEMMPLSSVVSLAGTRYRLMLCDDLCNLTLETQQQAMARFNQLLNSDSEYVRTTASGGRGSGKFGITSISPGAASGAPSQPRTPTPG